MFIEISKKLKTLSRHFPEGLFVVGGYVRNKILSLPAGDVDLASSVDIEEVENRLKGTSFKVKIKNAKFGAILITSGDEKYEYTRFRKEVYKGDGSHCPCEIFKTDKIEEDAIRRDFSVNSIYYNINKDEVIDYYHGIIDLKQKIIRCNISPDEVLKNDGERILRMVRFSGELNFKIDSSTLKSAIRFVDNVEDLQGVRKRAELEKILYCDKRYSNKNGFKRALKLLNVLGIWRCFGLTQKYIKFDIVYKAEDRFLGLLIDIIDTQKPECLETFLINFLTKQFGYNIVEARQIFKCLAGYYSALDKMKNKQYFFKYFGDWTRIYPLLGCKSKHIQNKYNFFYQYIIEHKLTIETSNLAITEEDIKSKFKNIDSRHYNRILNNLLSKVFDGKITNEKSELLKEIEKNLQNY